METKRSLVRLFHGLFEQLRRVNYGRMPFDERDYELINENRPIHSKATWISKHSPSFCENLSGWDRRCD